MQRAYSTFEVRSVDEELRVIEGIANSASVDSHETVIEPSGAVYRLPIPLFFHTKGDHDHDKPIGDVTATDVRNGQRWFRAQIPKIADDGTEGGRSVKHRVDAAWADIKHGLVRGASIEFIPIEPRPGVRTKRWTKWDWRGLAIVPVPSNMDATIVTVRSISESHLAASGEPIPASRGQSTNKPRHPMTDTENLQVLENRRAANVARMNELNKMASDEGRTKDASEQEEFDTLSGEVISVDRELVDVRTTIALNAASAVPVNGNGTAAASQSRGNSAGNIQTRPGVPVVRTRTNLPPGIGFARYVMSLIAAKGVRSEAADYARAAWGDEGEEIALQHRAAIAPGTTVQATFAAPLVPTNFLNEFLELLRPSTLIGRIPGLRHVPFNISMPSQTAGGTYKWVGEGKYKPVTNAQFAAVTLGMAKASGIIVLTEELVRSSAPSAQEVVRNELINGITQFLDTQFVDPAVAAVANVNPASITNGIAGTAASGTTEAAARTDFKALLGGFVTGNFGLGGTVLLMNEGVAFTLAMTVNAVGESAFPGMSPTGGTLLGIPVVTSNVIGADIFAIHAPSILLAEEGGVEIDISREASLQMDSAPTDPPVDATVHVSLWQANLVALRAERFINWGKARTGAVRRINTVAYA